MSAQKSRDASTSAQKSPSARVFRDRILPRPAKPSGYAWLIDEFELSVPLPRRLTAVAESGHGAETDDWLLLSPRLAPAETLIGHLTLALKREGVDLAVLSALFERAPKAALAAAIRETPHGEYARRVWFLFEWLTGKTLDIPDSGTKRSVVDALDTALQYGTERAETSARHRVRNNLPGIPAFCPLVRVTDEIERMRSRQLDARAREVIGRTSADVMARAAAFLQLKDSKASFAIENERPLADRAQRWARAIARAGTDRISVDTFELLQRIVIGDARLVKLGIREEGGFIGEHDRDTREPIPAHIGARHQDLRDLLAGLEQFDGRIRARDFDPVAAAAAMSFGFVYIHPFEDGNGRLHRWIIHNVLASMGFTPSGLVFPVSAVMLRLIGEYKRVLESYSRELLPLIEWRPTTSGNVEVLNDTAAFYRYFDATAHTEFLYRCVHETVEHDLPDEVAWLEAYDRFAAGVQEIVDMPARTIDLLHGFLRQNNGRLSDRARSHEFATLTEDEVATIEQLYQTVQVQQSRR